MNKCVICCPGPSLIYPMTIGLILQSKPDSLIAVNGAVLADLSFDFWVVQDIEVFDTVIKARPNIRTPMWVPARWPEDLKTQYHHLNLEEVFKEMPVKFFPGSDDKDGMSLVMPFGQDIAWREFTVFAAIGMAILHGAHVINLYGADMQGRGYFRKDLENERLRQDEQRWQEERAGMKKIIEEAYKNGIRVILNNPGD